MDSLRDYVAFVTIVEAGSLTAAARTLGRSLQAVSRSLATLEDRLGVTLLRRTTRRSAPTEAGLACYRRLKFALAELELAEQEARETAEMIGGPLRISASTLFGSMHVVPVAAAFLRQHDGVMVDLVLGDEFVDPVADRFDVAVRIGDLASSTLVARRLATMRRVAFASPAYLGKRGRPSSPDDLAAHDCLLRAAERRPGHWTFAAGNSEIRISVDGSFKSNSAQAVNAAAAAGLGVAVAPLWQVEDLLRTGEVEIILREYEPPPAPLHALWPAAPSLPSKVRRFVDALAARCRAHSW